ncbi:MAG TPA: hypothetical protein VNE61_12640 [Ktedonobacteraceae bacterium]|nr:hypothetical protein [Ktedonobacteraceae bacterium]
MTAVFANEADVRLEMEDGWIKSMGNYVAPTRSYRGAQEEGQKEI